MNVVSELDVVTRSSSVQTRDTLAADLRRLGVGAGACAMVHCSLSAIGWVAGGAEAVILALRDVVTESGTVVMPAQSGHLSDPEGWIAPAIPAQWHEQVRATMPAFDPRTTPTRSMGAVAEQFRSWPGVRRSTHPALSFAALGPRAERITRRQPLEDPMGEESPLGALYEANADIVLIGVGFERCTGLHLAERRAWPGRAPREEGAPMMVDGQREWVRYFAPPLDSSTFPEMGRVLARRGLVTTGKVGAAVCRHMKLRAVVDTAADRWRAGSR